MADNSKYDLLYNKLKERDYALYIKTIEKAGMLSLKFGFGLVDGFILEANLIDFVLDIVKEN
jgi:hypothetical protein